MFNDNLPEVNNADLLVIGTGIAGLSAAITAAEGGQKVIVLTKADDGNESNSYYAQGGIIGPGRDDSPDVLIQDIVRAGASLSYLPAVEVLALKGPELVKKILVDYAHVPFSQDDNGEFDLTREGAHSRRRIFHCADSTGAGIVTAMLDQVRKNQSIVVFDGVTAIDLMTTYHHSLDPDDKFRSNHCIGCYAMINANGRVVRFFADNTILATGGLGQIFLHSTNPKGATGDGIAMACRSGARIINTRFVQFHPTTLYHQSAGNFLISEALRGEGARLLNAKKKPFMQEYDPELLDLAPRDVVARAIFDQLTRYDRPFVYLDIANSLEKGLDIKKRFPSIYRKCLEFNIDITKEPIPVVPAAHYSCGGIQVDLNGLTSIENLYAVGEVSCTGLHGANRLASSSLLEGLVWGYNAAKSSTISGKRLSAIDYADKTKPWQEAYDVDTDPLLISQDMLMIKYTMWNYAGIIRTKRRLRRAHSDLQYLSHRIMKFYNMTKLTRKVIELRNEIVVAKLIVQDALQYPSSAGCHMVADDNPAVGRE